MFWIKREKKRGQASYFVLAGIIVFMVLAVLVFIFSTEQVKSKVKFENLELPIKIEDVERTIDSCLKKLTETAINSIAFNGGFIDIRNSPIEPLGFYFPGTKSKAKVAYGLFNDNIVLISEEGFKYQLKEYLRYEVPLCSFPNGFKSNVKQSNINVDVKISQDFVDIKMDYPVVLKVGDLNAKTKETYKLKLKSNIGEMRNVAEEIVKQQKKYNGQIEISNILSFGYDIKVIPIDKNTSVIMIYDKGSTGLIFMFGSKNKNE